MFVEFTLGYQQAGSDDLLAKIAYVLVAGSRSGDLNRHRIRAGARVCLADLEGVRFPSPNRDLSTAVISRRMDNRTVFHDVYAAAIRRAP